MTAADRLNEIEARHIAWHDSLPNIAEWSDLHGALSSTAGATADELAMAWELARNDVPALVAALRAVLDLHRESRNDVDHTPPCEHCHGEPGVHACGCWADEKWPTVCAVCMEGTKGASVAWPCPTVRAIEEALS